jgi:hypothetical protein
MTDWLKIDEEGEISVEEIMRQIKAHIAQQKVKMLGTDMKFEGKFSQALYDELTEAMQENENPYVELQVTSTPIPVLGRLIDRLRRSLHELVLFYTNQSIGQQVALNKHLLTALAVLVQDLERSEGNVATLRTEIVDLKARLAKFEG